VFSVLTDCNLVDNRTILGNKKHTIETTLKNLLQPITFIFISLIITSGTFLSTAVNAEPIAEFEKKITQLKGKVVYVDFWASWCGPCRQSFPWLNAMQSKLKDKGFVVLSVNVDAQQSFADEFLTEFPANFSVIYDPKGQLARKLKVAGMPSSFLVNRQGKIVSRHVGFNAQKQVTFEQEIDTLLLEK